MNAMFDRDEIATLIQVLHTQGIAYLLGEEPPADWDKDPIPPVQLIQRLAACGFPLVEHASISLFILHPELAPSVVAALESSKSDVAENIAVATLATLYMQQWWLFRLAIALGHLPSFPEEPFARLWEERHLPPPSAGYGRDGLLALEEYQQRRYDAPITFLGDWQNQIDHLLAQEEAHQRSLSEELKDKIIKQMHKNEELSA
jgi:hypothetical protein